MDFVKNVSFSNRLKYNFMQAYKLVCFSELPHFHWAQFQSEWKCTFCVFLWSDQLLPLWLISCPDPCLPLAHIWIHARAPICSSSWYICIYTLFCLSWCLETGGKIQDGCTFFMVSVHFSVAESHRSCATPNCIKDTQEATHFHLFVFCRREQLLQYKHTAGRWMLHALAEWCVCVLEQESVICATMNM